MAGVEFKGRQELIDYAIAMTSRCRRRATSLSNRPQPFYTSYEGF